MTGAYRRNDEGNYDGTNITVSFQSGEEKRFGWEYALANVFCTYSINSRKNAA